MIKKIGVLTSGGDCPGLNAVLRAIVKTAIVKYGYEVIGFKDGYRGLVLNNFTKLTPDDVSGILDKGGTILGTSSRDNPFHFNVERDGVIEWKDMSDVAIENINMHNIDCMVIVGGTSTFLIAKGLANKGVKVIGIPQNIDNEIGATDVSFGFMSAVEIVSDAIDKLHSTAEAYHRVMILEVTGKRVGWIALESGISAGADVILIPEIKYDMYKVAKKIMERKNSGKSFSIVVVAEGAKSILEAEVDENDEESNSIEISCPISGGVGNYIACDIEKLTSVETTVTVLGHLQRGGRPVTYDRILSTRFGVAAIELVNKEEFGKIVILQGKSITTVSLNDAAGMINKVKPNGEMVSIAKSIGVGFGD